MKYQPPRERFYWLCALAIPEDNIPSIEHALSGIAQNYFGDDALSRGTEFHATHIVGGHGVYKGRPPEGRVELFKDLTNVIDAHPDVGRIEIRLDPSRMSRDDLHHIAFMFLVEKVNDLMHVRDSRALLIADHDQEMATPNVRSLAGFRKSGTDFAFGRAITHIVDTIHHTRSHESRLLQLADIYAFAMSLKAQESKAWRRVAIIEHINSLANFAWPTKFKNWPPNAAT